MNIFWRRILSVFGLSIMIILSGCGSKPVKKKPTTLVVEHFDKSKGLSNENITCVAAFGGQIWAGSKKGLFCYDGVNWKIHVRKNTNSMGSNLVGKLKVSDNCLWISTDGGACKFDGKNWSSVYTGGRARAACGKGSEIAIGTAHGVEYSNGGAFKTLGKESAGLVYDEVSEIAFDTAGKLWVGTRSGMSLLSSGVAQNYTGPAKTVMGSSLVDVPPKPSNCRLIGNNIKTIIQYKGMIAIGTTSGLSITDMQNNWTNYFSEHKDWAQVGGKIIQQKVSGNSPLPGNIIRALATTSGNELLFVGTNRGLAILKDNTWVDFSRMINIPSINITGLAVLDDNLWVGTSRGLYCVKKISTLYDR